ncbi:MAG: hypothetical protein WBW81_13000 [Methylocella sp.]
MLAANSRALLTAVELVEDENKQSLEAKNLELVGAYWNLSKSEALEVQSSLKELN